MAMCYLTLEKQKSLPQAQLILRRYSRNVGLSDPRFMCILNFELTKARGLCDLTDLAKVKSCNERTRTNFLSKGMPSVAVEVSVEDERSITDLSFYYSTRQSQKLTGVLPVFRLTVACLKKSTCYDNFENLRKILLSSCV